MLELIIFGMLISQITYTIIFIISTTQLGHFLSSLNKTVSFFQNLGKVKKSISIQINIVVINKLRLDRRGKTLKKPFKLSILIQFLFFQQLLEDFGIVAIKLKHFSIFGPWFVFISTKRYLLSYIPVFIFFLKICTNLSLIQPKKLITDLIWQAINIS